MENSEIELLILEKERRRRQSASEQQSSQPPQSLGRKLWDTTTEGISGVPSRLIEHVKGLGSLPSEFKGLAESSKNRFGKNLISGGVKGLRSFADVIPNTLEGIGLKQAGDFIRAPAFDIDKKLGLGEKQPGDSLAQSLLEKAPSAIAAAYGAIPLMAMEGLQAIGNKENPLTNAITAGLERLTGKAVTKGVKAAPKYAESLSPVKTANKASKIIGETESYFKKGYQDILNNPGLPDVFDFNKNPYGKIIKRFKKGAPGYSENVEKALSTRSLEDLHYATTDLGNYRASVKSQGTKASPKKQASAKDAELLKRKFEKILDKNLSTVPGLQKKYRALDKEFIKKGTPITSQISEQSKLYNAGRLDAPDFLRSLRAAKGGALFRKQFGKELPGIKRATHDQAYKNIPLLSEFISIMKKGTGI